MQLRWDRRAGGARSRGTDPRVLLTQLHGATAQRCCNRLCLGGCTCQAEGSVCPAGGSCSASVKQVPRVQY